MGSKKASSNYSRRVLRLLNDTPDPICLHETGQAVVFLVCSGAEVVSVSKCWLIP